MNSEERARADVKRQLLALFRTLRQAREGADTAFLRRDHERLTELQSVYSPAQLESYIKAYFEMDDEFFVRRGYSFGVFCGCVPQVQSWLKRGPVQAKSKATAGIEAWLDKRLRES